MSTTVQVQVTMRLCPALLLRPEWGWASRSERIFLDGSPRELTPRRALPEQRESEEERGEEEAEARS
jgi:hypothetical protein